ncbi:4'-phosphopantetheinyl transferase family protein [Gaoshiqia sediminis]|uniref:4'-phosphopantetheinyl transferase superfamily protein n=1 Tax=Gaoshiqia sediminis TaxID=2986998 RepID=A0AA41Y9Z3_9BACT|nr:4'-phosphopantetheinyl transferase superfamily protein [Gaoshiqia sediminis]MCW0481990.1 4'-phosphopantetheinyl transferase superfamily protein [Gaoshiqia sediminis]
MPLLEKISVFDGLLLIWELTETPEELRILIPEALSDKAFSLLTNPKRRKEWLAVRLLLREVECSPAHISYTEIGRPQIEHEHFHQISISHSDKLAGVFLHPSKTIGLDIENADRDFVRVEKKYLSPKEMELARTIPNGHGLFWGIKEAAYKAAGIPGIHFARQIQVGISDEKQLSATLTADKTQNFRVHQFQFNRQLIVCLIDDNRNNPRTKK